MGMNGMNINLVTTFNVKAWELYAKEFVQSFNENWDEQVQLAVYYDGGDLPDDVIDSPRISYFELEKDKEWKQFHHTYGDNNGRPEGYPPETEWPPKTFVESDTYNYRMDAARFSHKVFALTGEAQRLVHNAHSSVVRSGGNPLEAEIGHLAWIDCDSKTQKKVSLKEAEKIICTGNNVQLDDISHLGRTAIDYSCTSFITFNLSSLRVQEFLSDYRGLYVSGEIFGYREWTDAFVFTRLLTMYAVHGLTVNNLSEGCTDLEAFDFAEIGNYMIHNKGNRKITGTLPPDVAGPRRNAMIPEIVANYKFDNILEIGTWSGARAIKIASALFEAGLKKVHYTGFDLFEEATKEDDEAEKNVKKHYSEAEVKGYFTDFAQTAKKNGKTFTFCLIKGNTRETLKLLKNKDYCNTHNIKPQFAYIDGGHSVETVRSDYALLKHLPVILFDDFYTPDGNGDVGPDTTKFGCNEVFDKDVDKDYQKAILATGDQVVGGGITNLAIVLSDSKLKLPPKMNTGRVPIKVNPQDCMPKEHIRTNIEENIKKVDHWVNEKGKLNDEHLIVASAGPSLEKYIPDILKRQEETGARIVCVKHSLPTLLKHGIVPYGCTILDPRSIDGESTHGVVRKTLFEDIPKETIMFVASMTDTSVMDYILTKTDNIVGFHAFSQAVAKYEFLVGKYLITGGTCAATRTVGLFHTLGFRNFHLYGFDSSLPERPDNYKDKREDGAPLFMNVGVETGDPDEPKYWTTGELLALAQDVEQMLDSDVLDLNIDIHCDGLVSSVWKDRLNKGYKKRYYTEILENV